MLKKEFNDNIEKLHTTELGLIRIKKNLSINEGEILTWLRGKIGASKSLITRKGKNFYIEIEDMIFTVNASSYTIITVHKIKK